MVICHKLNQFNSRVFSFDFTRNYCRVQKAKKFSTNPAQFECVTIETRYQVFIAELLIQNLKSQVAKLVRRPRIMMKMLYFSGGYQFFQITPGIKSHYEWVQKSFIYWPGRHNLGPSGNFRKFIWDTGAYLSGALGQRVSYSHLAVLSPDMRVICKSFG